jgi:hypothetical protein
MVALSTSHRRLIHTDHPSYEPWPRTPVVRNTNDVEHGSLSTRGREAHQPRMIRLDTNRSFSTPYRQDDRSQCVVGSG